MIKPEILKQDKMKNMITVIGLIGFIKILKGLKKIFFNYILKKLGFKNKNALKDIKWVLITGATSGLGWKLMELLVRENVGVICLGRNKKKLDYLKNFLKKKNYTKYFLIQKDLGDIEDTKEESEKWEEIFKNLPEIDLVINNAGISHKNKIEDIPYENYLKFFNTNMISPILISNTYIKNKLKKNPENKQKQKKDKNPKINKNKKINIILSSSGLSKIPIGFSAFYPYNKHFANNHMLFLKKKLQINKIPFSLNSILLGQIYSNISNMTNLEWTHENDLKNKKNLHFGYITSTDCAESVVFQAFGEREVEVLGHPDHFLKFFFVRWWNLRVAGYLLTKKRLWMIENNVNSG